MSLFSNTPTHGQYLVVFVSKRRGADEAGYRVMAEKMVALAKTMPGFVDALSFANEQGQQVTLSYWESAQAIANWRNNAEHQQAQQLGRSHWYEDFDLQVCKIERAYQLRDIRSTASNIEKV